MKKPRTLLSICTLIISICASGQSKGYVNLSAVYVEKLGYQYEIRQDDKGNSVGVCILPNGSEVNAWDFYKGKVAKEYSYCAKKGYSIECEKKMEQGYETECAVCTQESKSGKVLRIAMKDLMAKNGDALKDEYEKESVNPEFENAKYNNNFKYASPIPSAFDWRSYNGHTYIGGVRDQGGCGSCYSFGANAAAEGTYNFANGKYDANCVDLSESFIIWCLGSISPYSSHFSGCNGADYDYMELQALCDSGVCYETSFPYITSFPGACTHWNDERVVMKNWYRASCSDTTEIKSAIMNYGVVDAAVYVTSSFQSYSNGIYSDSYTECSGTPCDYTSTNHAIALVGWGHDPVHGLYWILRNSWGVGWGESGYMRIKWNAARVACSVAYLECEIPDLNDPTNFAANVISSSQIDLSWSLNSGRDVLLAWSTDPTFGTPAPGVNYSAGETIPGGDTVLYAGSNTTFSHNSLNQNTIYYYKIWTKNDATPTWSAGLRINATTNALETPYNLLYEIVSDSNVVLTWNTVSESFSDGFETGDLSKWADLIVGPSSYWYATSDFNYVYEGNYGGLTNWDYNINTWLISPTTTATSNTILSFYWQSSYYWHVSPYDNGDLYVIVSLNGGSTWLPYIWTFGEIGSWSSWTWYQTNLDLSAYSGQEITIGFNIVADDNADIAIDNVYIGDNGLGTPIGTFPKSEAVYKNSISKKAPGHIAPQNNPKPKGSTFSAYAVYRNDIKIAETDTTTYMDVDLDNGSYYYYVTSLYTSPIQESDPSNTVILDIGYVAHQTKRESEIKRLPDGISPQIDGQVDALWSNVDANLIDRDFTGEIPTLYDATWKAVWNDTAVYVLVEVSENNFYPSWLSGYPDWASDKFEVYFDVNASLIDGLGAMSLQGHYQVAPNFSQIDQGTVHYYNGSYVADRWTFSPANYVYEYEVPFSTLLDNNSQELDPTSRTEIGFDVYVIDLDEGQATRNRAVWANTGTLGENWNIMDSAGIMKFVTDEIPIPPPDNPLYFIAEAVSTSQINLSWVLDCNRDILLAWSPTNTFGTPEDSINYIAGNTIPGGGTVLCTGNNEIFDHSSLSPNTTYYYKIWTKASSIPTWTSGVSAQAQTHSLIVPFNLTGKIQNVNDIALSWNIASDAFSDGFESGDFVKWDKVVEGPGTIGSSGYPYWYVQSSSDYVFEGSYSALTNWGYNLNTWLISPAIFITDQSTLSFKWFSSYYWHVTNDNGDLFVKVSLDGGTSWKPYIWTFGEIGPWDNWTWYETTIDLAQYEGRDIMVAFNIIANNNADIALDDVIIGNNLKKLPAGTKKLSSASNIDPYSKTTSSGLLPEKPQYSKQAALNTFAIYRNSVRIAYSSVKDYLDEDLAYGTYTYFVTSVSPSLEESEPSNEIEMIVSENGIQIVDASLAADITLYPVPASDILNVELKGLEGKVEMIVYDMLGKEMFINDLECMRTRQVEQIKIGDLKPGIYYLKVSTQSITHTAIFTIQ